MRFLADLHIHSHYSISTSRLLTPEHLDAWARRKGIAVIGSGDFTHPGWLQELAECLEPADAERGLYRLKDGRGLASLDAAAGLTLPAEPAQAPVRFLLSAEISNIYRQEGRTRKVHNLLLAPDLESAGRLQRRLAALANLASDGRPILGLSSRDLLEMALECSPDMLFVPAHIWTPWFSALGDRSGFDSIRECYGDLAAEIRAVESGLSSDPPMNWLCSFLDPYTLISNSDAHSPEKLGRECNLFDCELSFSGIARALRRGAEGFLGTVEFFPEEGKYHHDGHRKCGVCWDPAEARRRGGICPVCGKPLTPGVASRVLRLADRRSLPDPATRPGFHSLIPLKEILAEITGVGVASREVQRRYAALLGALGPELPLLMEIPPEDIERAGGELLAEAVRRMRAGEVITQAGYDGEYGRVRLFAPEESAAAPRGTRELGLTPAPAAPRRSTRALLGFDLAAYHDTAACSRSALEPAPRPTTAAQLPLPGGAEGLLRGLNPQQQQAATYLGGPALVLAGPGTGKTHTLSARVAFLLQQPGRDAQQVLALTFTNKAARQMRERLEAGLGPRARQVRVCTFHAFGLGLLRSLQEGEPVLLDEQERLALLASLPGVAPRAAARLAARISRLKQELASAEDLPDRELASGYTAYESALRAAGRLDLDDLVRLPVLRLLEDPELLAAWRARTGSLLVDEFQDVNLAQYRLLRLLAPEPTSELWAVGDPDQAIYGFRGADARFLEQFSADYPGAAVFRLPRSYRCSDTILQASAQVLGPAAAALEGPEPGVALRVACESSDRGEAEFVARSIEEMLGGLRFFSLDSEVSSGCQAEGIGSLADFAVLCRTGRQMPVIEAAFRDHAIPYRKADELPFFRQEPCRSLLTALRGRREPSGQLSVRQSVQSAVDAAGAALDPARREALEPLLELAEQFGRDLRGFLELTALGGAADGHWGADNVALLTIHAAKGLEWPCVFLVGCEEGLLPYTLFGEQEGGAARGQAEERRLFYVGMTRAARYLYLTRARRRRLFGRELRLPPSPYLLAIERHLTEARELGGVRHGRGQPERQLDLFSPER